MDCIEAMKDMDDNAFDLAIVDPPYGIKESSYRKKASNLSAPKGEYNTALWGQKKMDGNYWENLFRVSKNQIVWGGNYFTDNLYESRCWIVWDKCTQSSQFADVELAWTSWKNSAKLFKFMWNGMLQGNMKHKEIRQHPTQKPVALYKWLLKNYAKEGDAILDTHLGSGSIAIACHDMGHDLTAYEIDKDYFEAAKKRIENHMSQMQLF